MFVVEVLNENNEEILKKVKVSIKGLSCLSLYVKFMVIDEKQVFIGLFNFDFCFVNLNIEIGVLLNSLLLVKVVYYIMD